MAKKRKQLLGCLLIILIPMFGCGIFAFYSWAMSPLWEAQIQNRYEEFCVALKSEYSETAYGFMSIEYRKSHPEKYFMEYSSEGMCNENWEEISYSSYTGKRGKVNFGNSGDFLAFIPLTKETGNWYFTDSLRHYLD